METRQRNAPKGQLDRLLSVSIALLWHSSIARLILEETFAWCNALKRDAFGSNGKQLVCVAEAEATPWKL